MWRCITSGTRSPSPGVGKGVLTEWPVAHRIRGLSARLIRLCEVISAARESHKLLFLPLSGARLPATRCKAGRGRSEPLAPKCQVTPEPAHTKKTLRPPKSPFRDSLRAASHADALCVQERWAERPAT